MGTRRGSTQPQRTHTPHEDTENPITKGHTTAVQYTETRPVSRKHTQTQKDTQTQRATDMRSANEHTNTKDRHTGETPRYPDTPKRCTTRDTYLDTSTCIHAQRHKDMSRNQLKTDKYTPKSTQSDIHKNTLSHKSKTQAGLERLTDIRLQTHRNMCPDTPRGVSSPEYPLPHTHNLPCSLGRCPHAGRAEPSRDPSPAHSGCLCGPLGTRSSGSCPCPHSAHQPDTAAPSAPLPRE